jgi:hypothetical protein
MGPIARPGPVGGVGHHAGSDRIGLDVRQDRPQIRGLLDDGGLEASLPNVADRPVTPVMASGVGDGQGLHDPADRRPRVRSQKQVKMIGHQAIAEQLEGRAQLGTAQGGQEGADVAIVVKDDATIVAPIQDKIGEMFGDRSRRPSHQREDIASRRSVKGRDRPNCQNQI